MALLPEKVLPCLQIELVCFGASEDYWVVLDLVLSLCCYYPGTGMCEPRLSLKE